MCPFQAAEKRAPQALQKKRRRLRPAPQVVYSMAGFWPATGKPGPWLGTRRGKWLWLSKPCWDPILGIGCTTHFRTYFSGDWDVHWGYGILTHSQMAVAQDSVPGEHQNRWYMSVHPPQNGRIGNAPWPNVYCCKNNEMACRQMGKTCGLRWLLNLELHTNTLLLGVGN